LINRCHNLYFLIERCKDKTIFSNRQIKHGDFLNFPVKFPVFIQTQYNFTKTNAKDINILVLKYKQLHFALIFLDFIYFPVSCAYQAHRRKS